MDERLLKAKQDSRPELELIRRMFLAGESMHVEDFAEFFHEDALYQFGNFPLAHGPRGIIDSSQAFLAKVGAVDHHVKNLWKVSDDTAVCEMEVTYTRHDGKVFTLPCCDTVRIKGDKVQELRIYMDITPVFAD
jgi:ketosteroid isomerase-like protein